jgi:hypothetical protein
MAGRLNVNVVSIELLSRIRAEYREMPCLQLSGRQAQLLFGLDPETWEAVLAALIGEKFLSRTDNGLLVMAARQA